MSSRPNLSTVVPPPVADDIDWIDTPITDEEWAAMPEADRQAILEAEAQVDRGEVVSHEAAVALLDEMIAEFEAKCRS